LQALLSVLLLIHITKQINSLPFPFGIYSNTSWRAKST
jgi:hypothetical protein